MKKAWQKTRVDRMLVDHILRAGHYSAAMSLAESSGINVREGSREREGGREGEGEGGREREGEGEREGEPYLHCIH